MRYKGGVISATPPTTSTSAATGVWTLVQQMQAQAAGNWPTTYWIGLLSSINNDLGQSVAVDSSGSIYLCGFSNSGGSNNFQIAKYNTSGAIQWQRNLGTSLDADYGYSIALDSSGNVYICGESNQSGTYDFRVAKYDTSGTIQWQKRLGGSGSDAAYSVAVDSSGNVYVCGTSDSSSTYRFQIAKYNTSGAIQWQRSLGGSGNDFGYSVAVDSSSNVYVCGYSLVGSYYDFQIAKYDTSGAIQWQRRLGSSSGQDYGYSIAVDSSGNVYVCGTSVVGSSFDFQIAKYNTSGTIQWQRRLGDGGSGEEKGYSVTVDSSGNVYVCGYSNASGSDDFQIVKYNTSGTIQWQRRLGSSASDIGKSIAVDSFGNVYVCGYSLVGSPSKYRFLFAKLPGDGSLTGTYTVGGFSFTYAASSLTDAATSLTDAASSLTDAVTTLTDAVSTFTSATSSLTSSVTAL